MSEQSYADALPSQYRLHWYVLERVLGQGGFGITYLARDANLDQPVAIKEYLPVDVATRRSDSTVRSRTEDQAERYRWGLDRFIREARTLARFDHPNIVRVLSVFEVNNTAYMVMRFEEGENLAALLERRRTLPEDELRRIVLPILDGLELVHNAGFIHRDIKPDNIHIRADGSPVLLDFGSARLAHGRSRTVTILVAPGYAPFEQYHSSGENQGPWTDIYGLGATCYRAIAGIEPMDAITRSRTELYQDKREALVPAINIGAGRYSPGFLQAIDHALAFAEKERPQTIAEWRAELSAGGVGGEHKMRKDPVAQATIEASPARQSQMRGPVLWAILGAVVAAMIVVLLTQEQKGAQVPSDPKPDPFVLPGQRDAKDPTNSVPVATAPVIPVEQARETEADIAAREAERKLRKELEAKVAALEARVQAESDARRKAEVERQRDAERARLETEKRRQAEAEAKRQEEARKLALARAAEARKTEEARKADEARKAAEARKAEAARKADEARKAEQARLAEEKTRLAAAAKASVPKPVPGADAFALAAEAGKRGDDVERYELLRKAAAAGHPRALLELGKAYATGRGVPANNFQAYVYLRRAQIAGEAGAASQLAQVKGKLQPAEVEHAERLLR